MLISIGAQAGSDGGGLRGYERSSVAQTEADDQQLKEITESFGLTNLQPNTRVEFFLRGNQIFFPNTVAVVPTYMLHLGVNIWGCSKTSDR